MDWTVRTKIKHRGLIDAKLILRTFPEYDRYPSQLICF